MKISIAIPAYTGKNGKGLNDFSILMESVKRQTYKDIEVCVSDHSDNDFIKKYCETLDLDVRYFKEKEGKGYWGANINNAIKNCTGDIIKFMCNDDYFSSEESLSKIAEVYESEKFKWAVCGGVHTFDYKQYHHQVIPRWTDNIHTGNNKLGGVSCILIENRKDKLYLHPTLNWMGDCDYYLRLNQLFGKPCIIEDPLIVYKQSDDQFTNSLSSDCKRLELQYVMEKYGN